MSALVAPAQRWLVCVSLGGSVMMTFCLACTAGALSHMVNGDVHGMLVVVHARCIVRELAL